MREGKGYSFGFWGKEKGREIFKVGGFDKGGAVVLEKAESLSCGRG